MDLLGLQGNSNRLTVRLIKYKVISFNIFFLSYFWHNHITDNLGCLSIIYITSSIVSTKPMIKYGELVYWVGRNKGGLQLDVGE